MTLAAPGGLERIACREIADPGYPGPNQVRVKVAACSLNFHDYLVAVGSIPTKDGRVMLADGSGIVEAVGHGVTEFTAGDHVISTFCTRWSGSASPPRDFLEQVPGDGIDGFAAEYVVCPSTSVTHAPKGIEHVAASTIPTAGVTAWRALVSEGRLKAGDWVLAIGTGGVSIYALQIARMMGARVALLSSSDEKLRRAELLGAEIGINYAKEPDWGTKIAQLTNGGVDNVIEVGGPETLLNSLAAVRPGGTVSVIGVLSGMDAQLPIATLMAKQILLRGLVVGSRAHQIELIRAMEGGAFLPVVDRVFAMGQLAEAFALQARGGHFGKVVVQW